MRRLAPGDGVLLADLATAARAELGPLQDYHERHVVALLADRGMLERDGLVLVAAGSTRAWKITAAGRLMLTPRRGPARERPVIGGGPHPR